jgi:hypothetical protein
MRSWTDHSGIFWLKDFLPKHIPGANVSTFGYPNGSSIDSTAQEFLTALDNDRLRRSSHETPIAFLAHGTGGLVVKQVCCLPGIVHNR